MNNMYLKTQIDNKKASKFNKMNNEEFRLNQKIIEKIREDGEYINLRDSLNINKKNYNFYDKFANYD